MEAYTAVKQETLVFVFRRIHNAAKDDKVKVAYTAVKQETPVWWQVESIVWWFCSMWRHLFWCPNVIILCDHLSKIYLIFDQNYLAPGTMVVTSFPDLTHLSDLGLKFLRCEQKMNALRGRRWKFLIDTIYGRKRLKVGKVFYTTHPPLVDISLQKEFAKLDEVSVQCTRNIVQAL